MRLHHQRGQTGTAQRVERRLQQHRLIVHHAQQQPGGIDPHGGKAGTIGQAACPRRTRAAQPQYRRIGGGARPRQPGEQQRHRRTRPNVARRAAKFMHPPAREAAAQRAIEPGMTRGEASADSGWPAPVQGGYGAPQRGQGERRLVH